MLPSKRKLNKIIKSMFYCIFGVLIFPIYPRFTTPDIVNHKQNTNTILHIREPTVNTERFIQFEKEKHVVYIPPKEKKHKKKLIKHTYRKLNVVATSYVENCSEGCTGLTATGIDVKNTTTYHNLKIIATDPSVIPLHSIVEVTTKNGSFKAIAEDTGGGINNFEIDVLMKTKQEAINFGRQYVTLTILRDGAN